MPHSGPGCCGSSPMRHGTGCDRTAAAGRCLGRTWRLEIGRQPSVEPVDPGPSPEERMLAADQRRLLLAALDRLRDEDRLVIGARYLLELSEAETAEALGIARGTVKSRLSRAMSRLRAAPGGIERERSAPSVARPPRTVGRRGGGAAPAGVRVPRHPRPGAERAWPPPGRGVASAMARGPGHACRGAWPWRYWP